MKRILIPVDFSPVTQAMRQAVEPLAKAFDSKVYFLHVASRVGDGLKDWVDMQDRQVMMAKKYPDSMRDVEAMARELRDRGCDADPILLEGPPADVILDEIARLDIDYVIIGSHGHGALYDVLVGSVTDHVLRNAPCPVIVVPSEMKATKPKGNAESN